jgi:hypothetical protein
MFRLIPIILVLSMISKKGNYFSHEEIVHFTGLPKEYLKTNKIFKRPLVWPSRPTIVVRGVKGINIADLLKHLSPEIAKSKIALVVDLDEDHDDYM